MQYRPDFIGASPAPSSPARKLTWTGSESHHFSIADPGYEARLSSIEDDMIAAMRVARDAVAEVRELRATVAERDAAHTSASRIQNHPVVQSLTRELQAANTRIQTLESQLPELAHRLAKLEGVAAGAITSADLATPQVDGPELDAGEAGSSMLAVYAGGRQHLQVVRTLRGDHDRAHVMATSPELAGALGIRADRTASPEPSGYELALSPARPPAASMATHASPTSSAQALRQGADPHILLALSTKASGATVRELQSRLAALTAEVVNLAPAVEAAHDRAEAAVSSASAAQSLASSMHTQSERLQRAVQSSMAALSGRVDGMSSSLTGTTAHLQSDMARTLDAHQRSTRSAVATLAGSLAALQVQLHDAEGKAVAHARGAALEHMGELRSQLSAVLKQSQQQLSEHITSLNDKLAAEQGARERGDRALGDALLRALRAERSDRLDAQGAISADVANLQAQMAQQYDRIAMALSAGQAVSQELAQDAAQLRVAIDATFTQADTRLGQLEEAAIAVGPALAHLAKQQEAADRAATSVRAQLMGSPVPADRAASHAASSLATRDSDTESVQRAAAASAAIEMDGLALERLPPRLATPRASARDDVALPPALQDWLPQLGQVGTSDVASAAPVQAAHQPAPGAEAASASLALDMDAIVSQTISAVVNRAAETVSGTALPKQAATPVPVVPPLAALAGPVTEETALLRACSAKHGGGVLPLLLATARSVLQLTAQQGQARPSSGRSSGDGGRLGTAREAELASLRAAVHRASSRADLAASRVDDMSSQAASHVAQVQAALTAHGLELQRASAQQLESAQGLAMLQLEVQSLAQASAGKPDPEALMAAAQRVASAVAGEVVGQHRQDVETALQHLQESSTRTAVQLAGVLDAAEEVPQLAARVTMLEDWANGTGGTSGVPDSQTPSEPETARTRGDAGEAEEVESVDQCESAELSSRKRSRPSHLEDEEAARVTAEDADEYPFMTFSDL